MTITAKIPAQHSTRTLLLTLAWLKVEPSFRRVRPDHWTSEPMDLDAFRGWLRACLDRKLTAADPRSPRDGWRKLSVDYQWAMRRDASAIMSYRLQRLVRCGSGLETAEGRRAAPDVHARFRARLD